MTYGLLHIWGGKWSILETIIRYISVSMYIYIVRLTYISYETFHISFGYDQI